MSWHTFPRISGKDSSRSMLCAMFPCPSTRVRFSGLSAFPGRENLHLSRCINLLERPTAGTVTVDGKEVTALTAQELRQTRKKIGMIFQHFNLMPSRTVAGNVAYPLRGSGLSKKETADKVMRLLELVGIGDKADAYPSQLSGGRSSAWPLPEHWPTTPMCYCATRQHPRWTPRPQSPFCAC